MMTSPPHTARERHTKSPRESRKSHYSYGSLPVQHEPNKPCPPNRKHFQLGWPTHVLFAPNPPPTRPGRSLRKQDLHVKRGWMVEVSLQSTHHQSAFVRRESAVGHNAIHTPQAARCGAKTRRLHPGRISKATPVGRVRSISSSERNAHQSRHEKLLETNVRRERPEELEDFCSNCGASFRSTCLRHGPAPERAPISQLHPPRKPTAPDFPQISMQAAYNRATNRL